MTKAPKENIGKRFMNHDRGRTQMRKSKGRN